MTLDYWGTMEAAARLRRMVRWAVLGTFAAVGLLAGVAWLAVVHCSPA